MTGVITRDDWDKDLQVKSPFSIRDQLLECEIALLNRAKELFDAKELSFNEFSQITNYLQAILDFATKINSIGFQKILTDMQQPAKAILRAIDELEKAAAKIQSFQKFFDILSRLVRIGGIILEALATSTTGGAVAAIGSLVVGLQDLVDNL